MAFNTAGSSSLFLDESDLVNLSKRDAYWNLVWERAMPGKRRGIIAPQNTLLENVVRKTSALRVNFILANARIYGYPIVFANDGFCTMVGRKNKAEVLSESGLCEFLYGPATEDEAKSALREACATGSSQQQIEILFYRLDGTAFWARVQVAQIKDEHNEVVLLLLTFKETFTRMIEGDSRFRRLARFARGFVRKEHSESHEISRSSMKRSDTIEASHKALDNLRQYRQETPNIPPFIIPHYGTFKNWTKLCFLRCERASKQTYISAHEKHQFRLSMQRSKP